MEDRKTFSCEVCDKRLSKQSHLRRHVKNVHPILKEAYTTIKTNLFVDKINKINPSPDEIGEYYQCNCNRVIDIDSGTPTCDTEKCVNVASKIECHPKKCNPNCKNQNFQKANSIRSLYVKSTKCKGNGLFTKKTIPANTFIIEYLGEVISDRKMNDRSNYSVENRERYDYHVRLSQNEYIDSKKYGNLSRFVNHSCQPNSRLEKWTVFNENRGEDIRLVFFSNHEIAPNEEITFDYKWNNKTKCYCQSKNCRKFI